MAKAEVKKPVAAKKPAEVKKTDKKVEKAPKEEVIKPQVSSAVEAEPKKNAKAVYHLKKREEDGMWEVLRRGGVKAIKLFRTKAEAEEFCKKMAENQDGTLLVHASKCKNKGKFIKN